MPQLPVPKSNPTLPRPVYSGDQFGALQGEAMQRLGRQITDTGAMLEERQTQREISALNAEVTRAQAELTVEWQDTLRTADPNDTAVAARFMRERVEGRLSKIGNGARTRESRLYFDKLSAGLEASFLVSTSAGQAELAGAAARANFEQTINNMNNAVAADPLSFTTSLPMVDTIAAGFTDLDPVAKQKLAADAKRDMARAAAFSLVDKVDDPDQARAVITGGAFSEYLTNDDQRQLEKYADTAISARAAAAKKFETEQDEAAQIEWMDAIVSGAPDVARGIVKDTRLKPASMRALMSAARAAANDSAGEGASNFNFSRDLAAIQRGEIGDPNIILNNLARGDYKKADANFLMQVVVGSKTPEGQLANQSRKGLFDTAFAKFVKDDLGLGLVDASGRANYNRWVQRVTKELNGAKARGEPGLEDPAVLERYLRDLDTAQSTGGDRLRDRVEAAQRLGEELAGGAKAAPRPAAKFKSIADYERSKAE